MPSKFKKFTRGVRSTYKAADRYRAGVQRRHPYVYAATKFALQNAYRAPRAVAYFSRGLRR